MKVRELIEGAVFTPGAGRDSAQPPLVTVTLPTFRRGDSGLLGRAIESVLNQSFTDFELIVVDDASTDSTAEVVAEAMRRDPRVSVIRHARNIGLPAISEFEAYVQARGSLIAFAFDDTVFDPDALRLLVDAAAEHPDAIIAGAVTAFVRSPLTGSLRTETLGLDAQESDLLGGNVIPNSAVLAPRSVLDEVGLFDPHISVARLCDYDLWLRARRRFGIHFLDTVIGEEHGTATTDSLGATYALDSWLADDRMRQERDEALRPGNYAEMDVFSADGFASRRSRHSLAEHVDTHRRGRPWMRAPKPGDAEQEGTRVLVLASPIDASVQLIFTALRDIPEVHVRVVDSVRGSTAHVAGADVVIVSRRLSPHGDAIRAAGALRIPLYYYLDDNLPLMVARSEITGPAAAEYALGKVRAAISRFAGVLTSTEELAASLREQGLHADIHVLPLAAPGFVRAWQPRPPEGAEVTFALFVGPHRLRDLARVVWPALVDAVDWTGRPARLLVPTGEAEALRRLAGHPLITVEEFPKTLDYFAAARNLRDAGVQVVVVPLSPTTNSEFKTVHPLLSAAILGASLVLPATGPYLGLRGVPGVSLVEHSATKEHWIARFREVLGDERVSVDRGELGTRFDAAAGGRALLSTLGPVLPEHEPDDAQRWRRMAEWLALEVATRPLGGGAASRPADSGITRLVRRKPPAERSGGARPKRRNDSFEISAPLDPAHYASYPVSLAAGRYRSAGAFIRAEGIPGELVGLEVVGPSGAILLHSIAALPSGGEPVLVGFDARKLEVAEDGVHEVRIFVRTASPAAVMQRVDERRGLRRAKPHPVVWFDRVGASTRKPH